MAIEIERKFLLASSRWRQLVQHSEHIRDGLLATSDHCKTRVRIIGGKGTLAVKTKRIAGRREEFEYEIPLADAERLLGYCGENALTKVRHYIPAGDLTWEIDEYEGLLTGVILAEIEVSAIDQALDLPDWIGREVTAQSSYRKINMLKARREASEDSDTGLEVPDRHQSREAAAQ